MITAAKLERRPRAFQSLTGLTPEQFRGVLEVFTPLWLEAERTRLSRPNRLRAIGAGASFKLAVPERLLMALIYLRQYLTMDFLGTLIFDLDKSNVSRSLDTILPVLEQALPGAIRARTLKPESEADTVPVAGFKPNRRRKIGTLAEFLERFPELEDLIVDSSEQERGQPKGASRTPEGKKPAGRPVDKKRFYSGKAGAHTLKTQLAVTPEGLIAHQSATAPGKMHDSRLFRRSRLGTALPVGIRLFGDKAYGGLKKVYPEYEVITPTKKPRKGQGELSEEVRGLNRLVSKVRIVVENAICRVKKYRICKDFYRGQTDKHGLYWGVVGGLVNLRLLDRLGLEAA